MNRETLYEFIDSKAIKEHLIKIGYEFKTIEAALVVNQSKDKTLKEKHNAYKWIIENMADFKVESKNIEKEMMFHELLARYIRIEDNILKDVMRKDDDFIYTYSEYWEGDEYTSDGTGIFVNYDELINAVREDEYTCLWVEKKQISIDNKYPKYFGVQVREDEEIMDVFEVRYLSEEDETIYRFFEDEVWIDIPVPFKKGDILTFNCGKYYPPHQGPMVFEHLLQWTMEPEKIEKNKKCWGIIDMTAFGYFLNESQIYYECMHNYLQLDYYLGELDNEKRVLKALSNYFKGNISVDLLMNAYHIIRTEEQIKKYRKYTNFTDSGMEMAGLK